MKFALVCLIAICTIAAQGSAIKHYDNKLTFSFYGRDGLLDKLRELIDSIVESIQKAIDAILEEGQEIVNAVLEKVKQIVDEGKIKLEKLLKKVQDKLDEIAKQSETARKCVEANRQAIDDVIEEAEKRIEVCSNNAVNQAKNILNDIQKEVDAVHNNIDELNNVVTKCLESSSNPIEVALCVTKQSDEIRETSLELIKNARNALEAGAARSSEIVNEALTCVNNAGSDAQDKWDAIVKDIQNCIADAGKFQYYLLN